MLDILSSTDIIIAPLYIIIVYFWARKTVNKNIDLNPEYKYFTTGLFLKIFGGLFFTYVYLYYYGGGDTVYYYLGSQSINRMAVKHFPTFIKLMAGIHTPEVASMFDINTGYPVYFRDPLSFAVSRFNYLFYLISFGSYIGNTIVVNVFWYIGIWHFYRLVAGFYPKQKKLLAIAVLFMPSIVFWSSGILKDGWCLIATFYIFICANNIFIERKKILSNIIILIVWSYIAISIRPYTFYVATGSALIWLGFYYLSRIKSNFLRTIAFPVIMLTIYLTGTFILFKTGSQVGARYQSIDSMLETAQIIQSDLSKEYYGGNSFDIGTFEPTLQGILSKFPIASVSGIYRPFFWEVRNPLMLLSAIESGIILLLTIWVLLCCRIFGFVKRVYTDPFLLSAFVFSITFAFFVGLTTANFGALVRYRSPVLTFFAIVLLVILSNHRQQIAQKKARI